MESISIVRLEDILCVIRQRFVFELVIDLFERHVDSAVCERMTSNLLCQFSVLDADVSINSVVKVRRQAGGVSSSVALGNSFRQAVSLGIRPEERFFPIASGLI